jgi:predicted MFS family arabinose efflux permease
MSAASAGKTSGAGAVSWTNYLVVTAAYWGFTLTDGALRTLVLLHFHQLGFSAITLAFLFLLYEVAGVVTNGVGGWLAGQKGLRLTLIVGLLLQVVALVALSFNGPGWMLALSVAYVMGCQALSGVAKDLTKMSSKSAIKVVVPQGQHGALFKWVAVLTGSKNALKGVGFFLGALLLQGLGFQGSLLAMAGGLALVLICSLALLPKTIGKSKKKKKLSQLFAKSRGLNILSAARLFLFGSRDVWFVVGVPIFLHAVLHWDFWQVGAFMGVWTIAYGIVQSAAPALLRKSLGGQAPGATTALVLVLALVVVSVAIPLALHLQVPATIVLLGGLGIYGIVFALNSSVHSYLVLAYSDRDEVAENVGFYYMSNAAGRLIGTLASGVLAWLGGSAGMGGVLACLWGAAVFAALASLVSFRLPPPPLEPEAG